MEKLTVKEFYKQLTKGKALMIGYKSIEKGKEDKIELIIKNYIAERLMEDIEVINFTTYTLKSYGAESEEESQLRHLKGTTYYKYHDNMIVAKFDWGHRTQYLIYAIK